MLKHYTSTTSEARTCVHPQKNVTRMHHCMQMEAMQYASYSSDVELQVGPCSVLLLLQGCCHV